MFSPSTKQINEASIHFDPQRVLKLETKEVAAQSPYCASIHFDPQRVLKPQVTICWSKRNQASIHFDPQRVLKRIEH